MGSQVRIKTAIASEFSPFQCARRDTRLRYVNFGRTLNLVAKIEFSLHQLALLDKNGRTSPQVSPRHMRRW